MQTREQTDGPRALQATLAAGFRVSGRGLHTNGHARVTVAPAPAGHGIRFAVAGGGGPVALSWENRAPSRMNTSLRLPEGGALLFVEHLAASFSAFGIDNALVSVEGREVPVFDGSARHWCRHLEEAGLAEQAAPRRYIRLTRPVQVATKQRFIRAEPASVFALDVTGEHYHSAEVEAWRGAPSRAVFVSDLADSRSSGALERMVRLGPLGDRLLALSAKPAGWAWRMRRGRLPPAVPNRPRTDIPSIPAADFLASQPLPAGEPVLRGARPGRIALFFGPWAIGGSRYPDERVRHYALDLLGDLMLAGHPLLGRVVAHRPTHRLAYAFVAALMGMPDAWEFWSPGGA